MLNFSNKQSTFFLFTTINMILAFHVHANEETKDFLSKPANKTKVLKSSNDLCHTKSSPFRGAVVIKSDKSNVFDSLDACQASGGELTEADRMKLLQEDPLSPQVEEDNLTTQNNTEKQQFAGLNWGAGIAFLTYEDKYIEDVSIDNGIIRINNEASNNAVAMLESHYFFTPGKEKEFGHGPFVSIGIVGEDGVDPLSLYALGWMIGFKRINSGSSWNFGIGYFINTETETLRRGLADGIETEETDPQKLLKKSDEGGLMLMFSANF